MSEKTTTDQQDLEITPEDVRAIELENRDLILTVCVDDDGPDHLIVWRPYTLTMEESPDGEVVAEMIPYVPHSPVPCVRMRVDRLAYDPVPVHEALGKEYLEHLAREDISEEEFLSAEEAILKPHGNLLS